MIKVENLSVFYGEHSALQSIAFSLEKGLTLGVIGPIGSGKTTLLLALAKLIKFGGKICIGGTEKEKELRKILGIVFQNPDDQLFMPTVFEDVAFGLRNLGMEEKQLTTKVEETLALLDLSKFQHRPSHHLSGGEKKTVALATVLAMEPEYILLDEPSSNLDPYHRRKILRLIQQLPQTFVIASHDLDFLWETADKCLLLYEGKQITYDNAKKILSNQNLLEKYKLELPLGLQNLS